MEAFSSCCWRLASTSLWHHPKYSHGQGAESKSQSCDTIAVLRNALSVRTSPSPTIHTTVTETQYESIKETHILSSKGEIMK